LSKQPIPETDQRAFEDPARALKDGKLRWHCPEPALTYRILMKKIAGCSLKFHS
jgi:hypothetical protein